MDINNISKRDKIIIISTIVVILCGCMIIALTTADKPIEPAVNTTIEEITTPTPPPAPEENLTIDEIIAIHDIVSTSETIHEENCTTTIGDVVINTTVEPAEEEFDMAVDGETVSITDEDIHNALMTCAIEDMTFEEFKRHVRENMDTSKSI